jgi:signal peptidase I
MVLTAAGCLSACGGGLTYRVPSAAMEPTLKIGQHVTVDTAATRDHPPKLNDIVVFHPPRSAELGTSLCGIPSEGADHRQACGATGSVGESSLVFIKRVVGLPGDRIAIVDGHVIRDGSRERDPYVAPCGSASFCNFPQPVTIPAGEYFMLGDNRGQSDDSRFWGPVPRAWIVGLARR